jgi:hypothetical protein
LDNNYPEQGIRAGTTQVRTDEERAVRTDLERAITSRSKTVMPKLHKHEGKYSTVQISSKLHADLKAIAILHHRSIIQELHYMIEQEWERMKKRERNKRYVEQKQKQDRSV